MRGHAEAHLGDGRVLSSLAGAPALRWTVTPAADGALVARLALHNQTSDPLRVERLLPLVCPDGLQALPLDALRLSQTGWQSWSRVHPPRAFAPNAASAPPPIRAPFLPHRHPRGQVSPWMSVLRGHGVPDLLMGFTRAMRLNGVVEVMPRPEGRGHALAAWCDAESAVVEPGTTIESEPLLLAAGRETDLLDRYAAAVADEMGAPPTRQVPTGWCSWYQCGTHVTEADVRRNLAALAAHRADLPVEVLQLDDGYQREPGDWLELKDTFPRGMPALTAEIRARGFTPGLWLAPFLLSARSRTYADHPDWIVRGDAGEPINALDNWGSANYALDTTHPAALVWLERVVRTVCDGWGFAYLKLDFLYAAALRGQRHDPRATSVQAYRRGLEVIRRAAGERFLLGCGAPLLPSVGLLDGMRIGSDVAPFWRREGSEVGGPALANAVRSTLARGWQHRRWWANDPDCVLARAHDSDLTEAEVRAWASVVALSGGMTVLGDDVARLEPERRALLARLFPPHADQAARPVESAPLADDTPVWVRLDVERPWGRWTIVGLGSWADEPRPARFDPAVFGLADGAYHAVDLWTGAHWGPREGALDLGILAPHGLRLLSVHPAPDRPRVVGSTGHLLGELMDVEEERWDGRTLTVRLAGPPARRGTLLVVAPPGFQPTAPPLGAGGLLRVPFHLARARTVRLDFVPRDAP